ncbi:MAG TPA: tetratricopeptide repeat protein [Anaerolineales bacterium]|nr:tetratricopeptide repeat protein [Anaerolineales bacterium]
MPDQTPASPEDLRSAIASLENQRTVLGDSAVDLAIQALEKQIVELQAGERVADTPPEQHRKLATILFLDIAEHTSLISGLDPEENYAIIEEALVRMNRQVVEAGGHATRFTGDGFKAIFGHPVAHDNDPEMAVRAALGILDVTEAYARELKATHGIEIFQVRIGIDTGLVLIGGILEEENTVKGEAVNLASRLEAAAPLQSVLISGNTHRLVRGIFDFEALPPLALKGIDHPVTAFRVTGIREQAFRDPTRGLEGVETPLVGRGEPLTELQTGLDNAVSEPRARMMTVVANAGVGKSRLMYEFEKGLPASTVLYKGRSMRERQNIPFGVFRNIFSRFLGIRENEAPSEIMLKFEREIERRFGPGDDRPVRAHFIGQLLGFDFSQSPYLEGVLEDAQQLRERAQDYLVEYFRIVSERETCVIFLEDIHWADDSSLDIALRLVELLNDRRCFILCNARPNLLERRDSWGIMSPAATLLNLPPLSRRDSRHLVGEILSKAAVIPLIVQEFIVSGAEGNPFYIEELIKMLLENGVISDAGGGWQIEQTRLLELEVPPTLTGVIQARLDSLGQMERTLLQQASVIGRTFWDGLLFRINAADQTETTERKIREALAVLQEKEMIYSREAGAFADQTEYAFKHALTREVTYETVLKRMRPVYHGLAAEWLIEHGSETAGEFTSAIAAHLELAGQKEQAAVYFRRAGEASMKQYANLEAISYLTRALDLLPETAHEERFHVYKARIQILSLTGDRKAQKQDLVRLADLARALNDEALSGESALLHAALASDQSDYPNIIRYARKAIAYGEQTGSPRLTGRGRQLWGRALISMGDYEEAKAQLETALALAREHGHSQIEADSLRFLGSLAQNQGTPEEARGYYQRSLEIARRTGDRRGELRALTHLGNISLLLYSYEEGETYFDQVLSISKEIGDRWGQGNGIWAFGDIFRRQANYRKASDFYNQAVAISEETGAKTLDMNSNLQLATIAMEKSEFSEAGRHTSVVLELAQRIGNRPMEARALREIGWFFHRQGDYVRAKNYYQQALLLFEEQANPRAICRAITHLGLLNLDLGNLPEAKSNIENALGRIEGMNFPAEKALALTVLGHVLAGLGDGDGALGAYRQAFDLFDSKRETALMTEPLAGMAQLHLAAGRTEQAIKAAHQVVGILDEAHARAEAGGDSDPAYLPGTEGTSDPIAIGLSIQRIFTTVGDPRAGPLLKRLRDLLQRQMARIDDVDLQQAFVNNIRTHREVLQMHAELEKGVKN